MSARIMTPASMPIGEADLERSRIDARETRRAMQQEKLRHALQLCVDAAELSHVAGNSGLRVVPARIINHARRVLRGRK